MNLRRNSIVLLDHHVEMNSDWPQKMNYKNEDFVILDPVKLFSQIDWITYEDYVRVINKIYSRLFEDVVMNSKTLICFWPFHHQFDVDFIDLGLLCKANSYEIEINKNLQKDDISYDFDENKLISWKNLVFFLIESLFEDIQLNERFDQIATLKSDSKTIVLFKLEKEGRIRYSYALDTELLDFKLNITGQFNEVNYTVNSFDSFSEMLEKLLKKNDLSLFCAPIWG